MYSNIDQIFQLIQNNVYCKTLPNNIICFSDNKQKNTIYSLVLFLTIRDISLVGWQFQLQKNIKHLS